MECTKNCIPTLRVRQCVLYSKVYYVCKLFIVQMFEGTLTFVQLFGVGDWTIRSRRVYFCVVFCLVKNIVNSKIVIRDRWLEILE